MWSERIPFAFSMAPRCESMGITGKDLLAALSSQGRGYEYSTAIILNLSLSLRLRLLFVCWLLRRRYILGRHGTLDTHPAFFWLRAKYATISASVLFTLGFFVCLGSFPSNWLADVGESRGKRRAFTITVACFAESADEAPGVSCKGSVRPHSLLLYRISMIRRPMVTE